jgi:hypothetical protein
MSLNFFKTKAQKTDATLQFQTVVDNLNKSRDLDVLNIDQFVQQENIHLSQHQGKNSSWNMKKFIVYLFVKVRFL